MTLDDYCRERGVGDVEAAGALGVSPECVRLWRKGRRMPRPAAVAKIEAWSGGAVTAADFYPAPSAAPRDQATREAAA